MHEPRAIATAWGFFGFMMVYESRLLTQVLAICIQPFGRGPRVGALAQGRTRFALAGHSRSPSDLSGC